MSAIGRRRSALATVLCTMLAATLMALSAGQAGAAPPEPVNPSDSDIQSSQNQADSAAAEVGRLAGLISKTEGDIDRLRGNLELKGEQAKAAILNVQLANQDAADAQAQAVQAAQEVKAAQAAVAKAQQNAADFAAASFRQGSVVGSLSSFMDATDATEVLSRQQLLEQVSANQSSVIAKLESARVRAANADSQARQSRDQAKAAQDQAAAAQKLAQTAQQEAADAYASGQQQLNAMQDQLQQQQDAYVEAMGKVADLKEKRQAYIDWLAAKRAEEEQMRQLAAEQARVAAEKAAAEKAAEEKAAEEQRQAQLEAERAQAAQVAAEQAAEKAAAEKAAKEKAEADRIAQQKEAEAKAAEEKAAQTKAAADKAAAERAKQAQAAAEKQRKDKEAQLQAQRQAQQQEAARIKKLEESKYYADCGAAELAGVSPIKKGSPGYRVGLDRNGNGVACEALSDSAAQPGNQAPAKTSTPSKPVTPAPPKEVYYASCAEAELAGVSPIKRGQPGYRTALDRNGNGVACEVLSDSGGGSGSSGGGKPDQSGNNGVPSDRGGSASRNPGTWSASKGQAAVAAAKRWVGTPYSWGGGNTVGPTTGICGPDGAWNDCHITGFDCSGLTSYAWAQAGVSIVALSATQYWQGQHVSQSNLLPGDLLFYANDTSDPGTIHHVAMYIGNGQMIEAPYSGAYVHITGAKFSGGYIGATRPGT